MPHPISHEINNNPAHDWGVALQLGNDIRDVHTDISQKKFKWPRELFERGGVGYDDVQRMVNEKRIKENDQGTGLAELTRRNERIEGIHALMCGDAEEYYRSGIRFLEMMPYEPEGVRQCFGTVYGFAGATLRVVKNEDFLYQGGQQDISRREATRIKKIVGELTERKQEIGPFMEHLMIAPASEYRQKK